MCVGVGLDMGVWGGLGMGVCRGGDGILGTNANHISWSACRLDYVPAGLCTSRTVY